MISHKILIISREMIKIRPNGLITLCIGRAMSCNATHMDENALVESLVFSRENIKNDLEQHRTDCHLYNSDLAVLDVGTCRYVAIF